MFVLPGNFNYFVQPCFELIYLKDFMEDIAQRAFTCVNSILEAPLLKVNNKNTRTTSKMSV